METTTAATPTAIYEAVDLMGIQGAAQNGKKAISFVVRGPPDAQARPKFLKLRRTGDWKARNAIRVYDPSSKRKREYARAVTKAMEEMGIPRPFFTSGYNDSGLVMEATFFEERPRYHYKRRGSLKKGVADYPKNKDVDNMEKFVMDALKGVVYNDDNMVRQNVSVKHYSAGAPYTELVFRTFE